MAGDNIRYFLTSGDPVSVAADVNGFLDSRPGFVADVQFTFSGGTFSAVVAYRRAAFDELDALRQFVARPPFCRDGCPHCVPDAFVGGTCELSGEHNPQLKRMCEIGIVAYIKNGGVIGEENCRR